MSEFYDSKELVENLTKASIPTFGQVTIENNNEANRLNSAREILNLAEKQAREIIASAEHKSTQIQENAYNQGFLEGQIQASSELFSAENIRQSLIQSSKDDLLEIISEIARSVVGEITDHNIEALKQQILKAINQAVFSKSIKIYINPADLKKLEQELRSDEGNQNQLNKIKLIALDEMPKGIVKIKSDFCEIETSPTLYLDNLINQLQKSSLLEVAINKFINKACDACDIKI
jgi:flagellar biosynthesis/type III secretory pathway protein FliH